jgi:hypothetical protein
VGQEREQDLKDKEREQDLKEREQNLKEQKQSLEERGQSEQGATGRAEETAGRAVRTPQRPGEAGYRLRGLPRSKAKGRSPAQWEWWELRPYERSRCAEHGGLRGMICIVCASHRGWSWSHHRRPSATLQGRKAKTALEVG